MQKGERDLMMTTSTIKELWKATGAGLLDCKKALHANEGDFQKAVTYLQEKGMARGAQKASRETRAGLVIVQEAGDSTCAVEVNCETDFVARTDEFKTLAHRAVERVLADAGLTDAGKLLGADWDVGRTTADVIQQLAGQLGENIAIRHVARYRAGDANIVQSYVHAGDVEGHYGPTEGRVGVIVELGVGNATAHYALQGLAHDLALHIVSANPVYLAPGDVPADVAQQERDIIMLQLAERNEPDQIRVGIIQERLDKFFQRVCLLKQAFVKDESVSIEELLQQKSMEIGSPVTINRFTRFEVEA
jgi:elongation factor Ts